MMKIETCDYMLLLDGKHIADFEELDDAKAFGYVRVDCGHADNCDVINRWTGEVMYHCHAYTTRHTHEGFDE